MKTNARVLVVDDNPSFAAGLRTALSAKHEVAVVTSRAQAEETVRVGRPDMVILGTLMPRGDAFRLHQWLRQTPQFRDVAVIVVDAPPERQLVNGWSKDEGLRLDADDYVAKPIEPAMLVPRVEKLLDRATRRIRVLVVDDHAIVREGIRALLDLQKDIQVVGEAVNGQEALDKVLRLSPDVVLMDIVMPVMNGLEAARRIGTKGGQAKVLMLTQYDDEENVLASSQVGALGFIPKRSAGTNLLDGIRCVNQGKHFMPTIAG